jgi:hypothetical protein
MSKLLAESLLSRLGINERQLTADPPYACPVHSRHTKFLWPTPGGDMNLYFRCTHPKCRFVGTPVDLVRAARQIEIREAMELFEPDAEFGDLFGTDQDQIVLRTRLRSLIDQDELRGYVEQCRIGLSREGQDVLMPLQTKGVTPKYLLETMCGMVTTPTPRALPMQNEVVYAKKDFLMLPYYSGTELTHIAVYNPTSAEYERFQMRQGAHGIFMERELSWPEVNSVLVCSSEMDALVVMSRVASVTTHPVNAVKVSAPDALLELPGLRNVYLLDHEEAQLNLPTVLRCWRTIAHTGMTLNVVELSEPLTKVEAAALRKYEKDSRPVWAWIADRVAALFELGTKELTTQLTSAALDDVDREFLLTELRGREGVNQELVDVIEYIRCAIADRAVAEHMVRRDSSGYHVISPSRVQLTNFTLHPSRFVQTPSGGVEAHCRVQIDGKMMPREITIPDKLLANGSRRLKHHIWKALGDTGQQIPKALHAVNLPGFDWLDLLHAFDTANYYQGVKQLGSHKDRIDFPNFYIDTHSFTPEPQHNNLFVTDIVRYVYATVDSRNEDLSAYERLFTLVHPSAAGVMGGLGHMVHHFAARLARGIEFRPNHFIYTSSSDEGSLWDTSFKQLCGIFSRGMMGIELLPGTVFKKQIGAYETLGDLPLFCRAKGRNTHVETWLAGAEGPLIVLADPESSRSLGRLHNTSATTYDLQAFDTEAPSRIDNRTMDDMRDSWPWLLSRCLARFRPKDAEIDASVPACIGYTWICEVLGVQPQASVMSLFQHYPPAEWVDCVDEFFIALNKILNDRSTPYTLTSSADTAHRHPDSLGWISADGVAHISRSRAVEQVNRIITDPINAAKLEEEIVSRGIGVAVRPVGRGILFEVPADEWERRAVRRVQELRAETAVPVLKFA